MKNTDDLIASLAAEGPAPTAGGLNKFILPLVAVSLVNALVLLLLVGEPFAAVAQYGIGPMVVKWGFSLPLAFGAAYALHALGKPGVDARNRVLFLALPFIAAGFLLGYDLANNGGMFPGRTWAQCLAAMGVFSPVCFAGAVAAARWLAPTELRKAGGVAGLFGGGMAMTCYAPFCPELGMLYMFSFYVLPILAMAGLGWLLGPKLLRW